MAKGFQNTTRDEVEPTVTEEKWAGGSRVKVLRHEAYGQITVSRINGSRNLYGSDFRHNGFVRVTINKSKLQRDLSQDWRFPDGEIVAVDMSEAQWANFVSSFNIGSGVPCTIAALHGKYIPGFPLRDQVDEYKADADDRLADAVTQLKRLRSTLEENAVGLSKTKQAALLGPVDAAIQQLDRNLEFVANSFKEHLEERVEYAKVEVHAYINNVIRSSGLEALQGRDPVVLLEGKEKANGEETTQSD